MSDDDEEKSKSRPKTDAETASAQGNFDYILVYVDASVVSEWLNRANRSLRKMYKWHRDNKDSYSFNVPASGDAAISTSQKKLLKYESFINFCNFWLGGGTVPDNSTSGIVTSSSESSASLLNKKKVFSDKQRRSLIEMEYSIICDEVVQAFQIGMSSSSFIMPVFSSLGRLSRIFWYVPNRLNHISAQT